jgi:hypothetical protein
MSGFISYPYAVSVVTAAGPVGGGALVTGETDAMGIDFTYHTDLAKQMAVTTASVEVDSAPYSTLTYTSPSTKLTRQSDGVWRYVNHNLFTNSEAFTAGTACTITSNSTTAPNGASTADTLVEDSTNAQHFLGGFNTFGNTFPGVFSVWVKAKDRTWIILETDADTSYFDVGNGVMGTNNAGGTITSAGSGWYLCKIARDNLTGHVFIRMATANNVGSYTGDGTSGIYIWGAQIKRTPVKDAGGFTYATGYLATGASAKYDLPYEWDVSAVSQGILIEEQRANGVLRSQEFSDAAWTKQGSTTTANQTTAPDGTSTADLFTASNATGIHNMFNDAGTVTAGTAYTGSVFVKPGTARYVTVAVPKTASGDGFYATFDTTAVSVTQSGILTLGTFTSATITADTNGWYRLAVTGQLSATNNAYIMIIFTHRATYTPDGFGRDAGAIGTGTETFYFWDAQVEAGSFPTSPIHTIATTVTRAADNQLTIARTSTPYANSAANSWVVEVARLGVNTGNPRLIGFDGTSNTETPVAVQDADQFMAFDGTNTRVSTVGGITSWLTSTNKVGIAYDENISAADLVANNGAASSPGNLAFGSVATITFGALNNSSASTLNGYLRKVTMTARRFSISELQTRTT